MIIKVSAWLGSDKHEILKSLAYLTRVRTYGFESHDLPKRETDAQLILVLVFLFLIDFGVLIKTVDLHYNDVILLGLYVLGIHSDMIIIGN